MNILYDKKELVTKVFTYTINKGGSLDLKVSNSGERTASIVFVNDKFSSVGHNIEGEFVGTRSYWHIMGAIAKKITEIEEELNAPKLG